MAIIMKRTDLNLGLAAYLIRLNHDGKGQLTKKERREIHQAMRTALLMLNEIPEPIEGKDLDNALANLLAYIVSNGKSTYTEKCNHLSNIVLRTRIILEMVEQTPVAEILDMVHYKKNLPFIRILKK